MLTFYPFPFAVNVQNDSAESNEEGGSSPDSENSEIEEGNGIGEDIAAGDGIFPEEEIEDEIVNVEGNYFVPYVVVFLFSFDMLIWTLI